MQTSILLEIIGALEKDDISEFSKFVNSPFFNRNKNSKNLIALFDYVEKYYPDLKHPALNKEKVYQALFPNQKFVKNKLEKLMSGLLALVKDFIIFQYSDIKQKESKRLLVLGNFYKDKKLINRFEGITNRLNKARKKGAVNIDFYLQQYLKDQLVTEFKSLQNKRKKEDLKLMQTLGSLDVFYILNKLQIANIIVLQKKFGAKPNFKDIEFLSEILIAIESGAYKDIPLIQLYYHSLQMLQEPYDDFHYEAFKKELNQHSPVLSLAILRQLQIAAINFCIIKYNSGFPKYRIEVFNLYKSYLLNGTLYYNDKLRPSTIKNIVHFGLKVKEFDWVKKFLKEHKDRITRTEHPNDVFHFNMAVCYFYQQEYEKALDHLSDTYEDLYYYISARRLELKIYFETKSPLLDSRIDAFKALVFRQSQKGLSNEQKILNNNFVDLLRQIQHPKTFKNQTRIKKLKEKIFSKKAITEKDWLLEKLEHLL